MLPRRCKKCRCYVAPQLHRCPRCKKVAPEIAPPPTKEDKQAAREQRDAKVPVAHSANIYWKPSALAIEANTKMVAELGRRLAKADTARLRNTIRSELREVKRQLARATPPKGKKVWTTEFVHFKNFCCTVFISPSKKRYVMAERDAPADLIIERPKQRRYRGMRTSRLQLLEKSHYARMKKAETHDETTHKKRTAVKKKARAAKRAKAQS